MNPRWIRMQGAPFRPGRGSALVMLAASALSACSAFTDPAVRLASCIHRAAEEVQAKNFPVKSACQLRSQSAYTVVLHPAGGVSDAELIAAGLPPERIGDLRRLQLDDGAGIYVLPHSPREHASYTSLAARLVSTPFLLVATKSARAALEVVVAESAYGVRVSMIR